MENSGKKIGEIYKTKDYSIFKRHQANRSIIPSQVKTLYNDMLVNGWLNGSNITINEKGEIIDGQHRLEAAIKANVPVNYTVVKGANSTTIRGLNTKIKIWNIITHLEGYVKEGNQNYVLLDRFMKNFPELRPTECMMLVKNSFSSTQRGVFESGQFVVRDMKIAYAWGHNIMKLRQYFEKGYNKSIFVRAMVKVLLLPQFDFDEFLHKVSLRPRSMVMCGTVDQYVQMIEDIYNYRRNNDEKIRLT